MVGVFCDSKDCRSLTVVRVCGGDEPIVVLVCDIDHPLHRQDYVPPLDRIIAHAPTGGGNKRLQPLDGKMSKAGLFGEKI